MDDTEYEKGDGGNENFRLVFPFDDTLDPQRCWKMIEPVTETAVVHITEDAGFEMQCLDRSHSSVLSWRISPSEFDTFEVCGNHRFGIIVNCMCKALKCAGAGATIEWTSGDDSRLRVNVSPREGGNGFEAAYLMLTMNVQQELLTIPTKKWYWRRVPTKRFCGAVAQLRGLSAEVSQVTLWLDEKTLRLCCGCNAEHSEAEVRIETTPGDSMDEESPIPRSATNPRRYQATLVHKVLDAASSLSTHTMMHWCDEANTPMYIRFVDDRVEGDSTASGHFDLFVACIIDDDDDENT